MPRSVLAIFEHVLCLFSLNYWFNLLLQSHSLILGIIPPIAVAHETQCVDFCFCMDLENHWFIANIFSDV